MAKPPKIELPAQLDAPYAPSADATIQDLQAQIAQCRNDAVKIIDNGQGDFDSRMQAAEWYAKAIEAMETRQNEIVAQDAQQKEALDGLRSKLAPKDGGDPEGGEGDDPTDPDAENEDDPADGTAGGDPADGTAPTNNIPEGQTVLVASARKGGSAVRAAAAGGGSKGATMVKKRSEYGAAYLTAAAGSGVAQAGEKVDWDRIGLIAEEMFGRLPAGERGGSRTQLGLGKIHLPGDPGLVASAAPGSKDVFDLDEAIKWALSGQRLAQEFDGDDTLLAAGGWCAPSETLYDLVDLITTDGMLDVPGITVNRGGVRYSLGPDFSAVFNAGANFTRTETQAIAGVAKPIVNIPCPSVTDNRMLVDGMYFTGDILSSKGWPEAYADFLEKATKAYAHYVNMKSIADQVTLSTAVDMTAPGSGTVFYANKAITTELLGAIELQITDMKIRNRLSMTQAVEVVLPMWLKGAVRSDLAKRQAVENSANISDADIAGYFTERGANVQWVYDWQDAFDGTSGGLGGGTAPVAWPVLAKFLIYPQGTFVRALSDVIQLNAVYDSTLLTTNQYVALFMEQARLTLKRATDARVVSINVLVTGATGGPFDYTATQPTT